MTELGFKKEEIAIVIGTGEKYVSERRKVFKEQGRGMDVVRTGEFVRRREERALQRRSSIGAMISFARIVDVDTVKDHIEYIRAKKELGELETSDMNLMRRIVPMDHDLLTLRNINFVVDYLKGEDKLKQAINFINECLDSAHDYKEKKWQEVMRLKSVLEQELEKRKAKKEAKRTKRGKASTWKART